MPFDEAGIFKRLYSWAKDRDSSIRIRADRMDKEMDGIVSAINDMLSGEAKFKGTFKITYGTAASPAYSFSEDPSTGFFHKPDGTIGVSLKGREIGSFPESFFTGIQNHIEDTKNNPHEVTAEQTGAAALLREHEDKTNNPHGVTAEQIGAVRKAYVDGVALNMQQGVLRHVVEKGNPHEVTAEQVGAVRKTYVDNSDKKLQLNLHGHATNKNNPHEVTAEQVGAVTPNQLERVIAKVRADIPKEAAAGQQPNLSQFLVNRIQDHLASENNPHNIIPAQIGAVTKAYVDFETDKLDVKLLRHIQDNDNPHQITPDDIGAVTKEYVDQQAKNSSDISRVVDVNLHHHTQADDNPHKVTAEQTGAVTPEELNNAIEQAKREGLGAGNQRPQQVNPRYQRHIWDKNNPHEVTAEQTGAVTPEQLERVIAKVRADIPKDVPAGQQPNLSQLLVNRIQDHLASENNPHNITPQQIGAVTKAYVDFETNRVGVNSAAHAQNVNNPHKVTAAQIGATTKGYVDSEDNKIKALFFRHTQDLTNPHKITPAQIGAPTKADMNTAFNRIRAEIPKAAPVNNQPNLNVRTIKKIQDHLDSENNPHKVTAKQIGAAPKSYVDKEQNALRENIALHIEDFNNPHEVTAAQIGATTKGYVDSEDDKLNVKLLRHALDYTNPHKITPAQIGAPTKAEMDTAFNRIRAEIPKAAPVNNQPNLNVRTIKKIQDHLDSENNPHKVTAKQIGAAPKSYVDREQNALRENIALHIEDFDNPHEVTAAQIGATTKGYVDSEDDKLNVKLLRHALDYTNPHKITPAQIGAVTKAYVDFETNRIGVNSAAHAQNVNNPHKVSAEQIGAATKNYVDDSVFNHAQDLTNPHKITPAQIGAPTKLEMNRAIDEIKRDIPKGGGGFNPLNQDQFLVNRIQGHLDSENNPHKVTAKQIGAVTKSYVDNAMFHHVHDPENPHKISAAQIGAVTKNMMNKAINRAIAGIAGGGAGGGAGGDISLEKIETMFSNHRKYIKVPYRKGSRIAKGFLDFKPDSVFMNNLEGTKSPWHVVEGSLNLVPDVFSNNVKRVFVLEFTVDSRKGFKQRYESDILKIQFGFFPSSMSPGLVLDTLEKRGLDDTLPSYGDTFHRIYTATVIKPFPEREGEFNLRYRIVSENPVKAPIYLKAHTGRITVGIVEMRSYVV